MSKAPPILTLKHLLSWMKQGTCTHQDTIGTVGAELNVSMNFLP
jgi:hypothetical protein